VGPRMPQTWLLQRPTLNEQNDTVLPAGALTRGIVFSAKNKEVVGGQGEVFTATAVGFFPKTLDIRVRDVLSRGGQTFEVLRVVSGYDDRDVLDHVGVSLREA
jgi:hypothetical protein